jgi:hypothetical protein
MPTKSQNPKSNKPDITKLANAIAAKYQADVIAYNGPTNRPSADRVLEMVHGRRKRPNVVLMLVTQGGFAESAYRVARCLQESYKKFTVLVPGWCKSAGTLLVLGAHEIVMTDWAELGPLDVQILKKDELESRSGLVVVESLRSVKEQVFTNFEYYLDKIMDGAETLISFKMASEMATKMAIGVVEPMARQIDPLLVGDTARLMRIAKAYGARLQIDSNNSKPRALELLVDSYPDHGFVIDRREAQSIFVNVRAPNAEEAELINALGDSYKYPASKLQTETSFLTDETTERKRNEAAKRRTAAARPERERAARTKNDGRNLDRAVGTRRPATANGRNGIRVISGTKDAA